MARKAEFRQNNNKNLPSLVRKMPETMAEVLSAMALPQLTLPARPHFCAIGTRADSPSVSKQPPFARRGRRLLDHLRARHAPPRWRRGQTICSLLVHGMHAERVGAFDTHAGTTLGAIGVKKNDLWQRGTMIRRLNDGMERCSHNRVPVADVRRATGPSEADPVHGSGREP